MLSTSLFTSLDWHDRADHRELQTVVSMNHWATYHSAKNFAQPDSFIPERWLDGSGFDDNKKACQPFGQGPRACIGRK